MKTARRRLAQFTCIAAAAALVVLAPRRRQASPAAAAAAAAARAPAPVATGASDTTDLGASGWQVQSSAVATQPGAQISAPGFAASGWLPVSNDDAGAPGTEIEALVAEREVPGRHRAAAGQPESRRARQHLLRGQPEELLRLHEHDSAPTPWPRSRCPGGGGPTSPRTCGPARPPR